MTKFFGIILANPLRTLPDKHGEVRIDNSSAAAVPAFILTFEAPHNALPPLWGMTIFF
jgi:hypothetical protein